MMDKYETIDKIEKLMWEELCDIAEEGKLSAGAMEIADKASHIIKSLTTVEAMMGADCDGGYSGARGRMYARRDSRGRYSREPGMNGMKGERMSDGHDGGYSGGGYSYDAEIGSILSDLRELMGETQTPKKREIIRKFIHEMEE